MKDIMYQEIDIKINVIFSQAQIRATAAHLDAEIKNALRVDFDARNPEPMEVVEMHSAIQNAHLRITTSVDARKNEPEISQYIMNKVIKKLPMGVAKIELMSLREEAEIYGNTNGVECKNCDGMELYLDETCPECGRDQ